MPRDEGQMPGNRKGKQNGEAAPSPGLAEEKIRERNQRKILKAATEIFSRKGFDGTRIAEIAERSGLPKANVYYYFASKEDIYTAAISHLIESWDKALEHISPEREPADALGAYVRAKLEYSRRNAAESRLFANEIIRGARFLNRKNRKHMQEVTERHAEVVDHWIAQGRLKTVDARHLFIMLWAATQFYGDFEPLVCDALNKTKLAVSDFDAAAETITRVVLDGLIEPGERPEIETGHAAKIGSDDVTGTSASGAGVLAGQLASAPLAGPVLAEGGHCDRSTQPSQANGRRANRPEAAPLRPIRRRWQIRRSPR